MKNKKLYSVSDAENLNITEIHNLYKKYISKSQVELNYNLSHRVRMSNADYGRKP